MDADVFLGQRRKLAVELRRHLVMRRCTGRAASRPVRAAPARCRRGRECPPYRRAGRGPGSRRLRRWRSRSARSGTSAPSPSAGTLQDRWHEWSPAAGIRGRRASCESSTAAEAKARRRPAAESRSAVRAAAPVGEYISRSMGRPMPPRISPPSGRSRMAPAQATPHSVHQRKRRRAPAAGAPSFGAYRLEPAPGRGWRSRWRRR